MKITVTKAEESKPEREERYPWTGISDVGHIVWFTGRRTDTTLAGMCIKSGPRDSIHDVGLHYDNWADSCFTPFHGTITIECP